MSLAGALRSITKAVLGVPGLGTDGVIRRAAVTYNAQTAAETTPSGVNGDFSCRVSAAMGSSVLVNGTVLKENDVIVIMDDTTFVPNPNTDTLIVGSVSRAFAQMFPIQTAEGDVAHVLRLRK